MVEPWVLLTLAHRLVPTELQEVEEEPVVLVQMGVEDLPQQHLVVLVNNSPPLGEMMLLLWVKQDLLHPLIVYVVEEETEV